MSYRIFWFESILIFLGAFSLWVLSVSPLLTALLSPCPCPPTSPGSQAGTVGLTLSGEIWH